MNTNGYAEIKAVEGQVEVARKAMFRSNVNLKNAETAFDTARFLLNTASQNLDAAKKENEDAIRDLKDATSALKAVNSKWKVIELDNDDESTSGSSEEDEYISKSDLDSLKPGSRVVIYEYKYHKDLYFNATVTKVGDNAKAGKVEIHFDGLKASKKNWVPKTAIARIL